MFTPSLTHVLPLWLNFSLLFTLCIPQINDISFENCLFHLIIVSVFTYSWNTRTTSTNIIDQNKEIKKILFSFFLPFYVALNERIIVQQVMEVKVLLMWHQRWSEYVDSVADLGEGPGGPSLPLFLDQNEARRAEKNFFLRPGPSPPYLRVWMSTPASYLKAWIRHWDFLFPSVFDFMYCYFRLVHQERFLQVPVMISEVSGFGLSKCLFISTCVRIFKPLIALHNLRNAHFRLKSLRVGLIR